MGMLLPNNPQKAVSALRDTVHFLRTNANLESKAKSLVVRTAIPSNSLALKFSHNLRISCKCRQFLADSGNSKRARSDAHGQRSAPKMEGVQAGKQRHRKDGGNYKDVRQALSEGNNTRSFNSVVLLLSVYSWL